MDMRWFVINEWLFYDLWGKSGPELKAKSINFLQALVDGPDGIVVLWGSPWIISAQDWINRENEFNVAERRLRRLLFVMLFVDSRKCRVLKQDSAKELPPILRHLMRTDKDDEIDEYINHEDEYLLQTWLSSPVKIECLVTADCAMKVALDKHFPKIKARLRNEFLKEYLRE